MKYHCICRFVITGDVPGSGNVYLINICMGKPLPDQKPPGAKSPTPYWQARLNAPYPGESPTQFLQPRLKSHLNPPARSPHTI